MQGGAAALSRARGGHAASAIAALHHLWDHRTAEMKHGVKRAGKTIADLDRLGPFSRIGKPEEVAALVAFLASDEAPFTCGSFVEITSAQAVA